MIAARKMLTALSLSAAGLVAIATHEGYVGQAYDDIVGIPTIGFGTTEGVEDGDSTTPVRALIQLMRDADKYEQAIKRCVTVPVHQHEFDAYLSFTYNVGATAFCKSTLVKKLNAGDYSGACNELSRWVYAGGKRVRGLEIRREKERRQCLGI